MPQLADLNYDGRFLKPMRITAEVYFSFTHTQFVPSFHILLFIHVFDKTNSYINRKDRKIYCFLLCAMYLMQYTCIYTRFVSDLEVAYTSFLL
jgi:hypothetical protein